MPRIRREPTPNVVLYNLRDARGETQEQVAEALNALARARGQSTAITGNHVSRWERGVIVPSRLHGQLLGEHFQVTISELGLARQRPLPPTHPGFLFGVLRTVLAIQEPRDSEDGVHVVDSQQEWLETRHKMHALHRQLAMTAAQLYPAEVRVGDTGILAPPSWTLPSPIDLANIHISYSPQTPPPVLDGTETFTDQVRPLRAAGGRYQRYSHAIRDVAKPRLFDNRPSWRLVDAKFNDDNGYLTFSDMNYFDAMDTCEAVAHETALAHMINDNQVGPATWRGLKFRKALGDPFDLSRRAVLLSINTLTLRRDKTSVSVILHNRDAANVATSGGIIGVMPAGVFQPSSVRSGTHTDDFDLWRNIMREYSEEFLGNPEHDGDGPGADYTTEPLRSIDQARQSGAIKLYCFGLGMGALDLWCGLETAAVIDAPVFDELFANIVRFNDEGSVVRIGVSRPTVHIPFTRETVDELLGTNRLAPETAYSLLAAWKNREQLLG